MRFLLLQGTLKRATKIVAKRVEKHPRSNLSCNKLGSCRLRNVVAESTLCHKICTGLYILLADDPCLEWLPYNFIQSEVSIWTCVAEYVTSLFFVPRFLYLYTVYPSAKSQLWILIIWNWSMSKERNVCWKRQMTLLSMRVLACLKLRESRVHEIEKARTRK